MPLPSAVKLFIDPRTGDAFGNFAGTTSLSNPVFTLGDTATVELYLVESTGLSTYPRQEIGFPTSPGIRVAVGAIDESPLAGTWTLSYGGDTTTALAFNATPAVVQAALNLLASITAAGGVTVSKIGDNYNIVFNTVGARTELTTNGAALIPLSAATVASLQTGDANKPAIYLVHLQRTVAGLATSFSPTAASQITVESLTAWDGTKATYRASISPDPKGGSFSLAFDAQTGTDVSSAAISVGASALDVQNALTIGALADGKVSVTQVGAYAYDITVKTQPATAGLTADAAGLLSFTGYKGDLNLNTAEAISLLDGAASVETSLEVEITSDSKTLTVLQIQCTLQNAVIDAGAVQPLVLDSYLSQTTADGRYFKLSQNLADGTAGTMRTNLGVYSTSQVDTALALKANLFEPVFSGKIQTPTIKNILNADLVIDSYNDTGAGTHYLHKFTPLDGKLVLATNGGGLTFPDGTTQITAATSPDLSPYALLSGATFTGKINAAAPTAGSASFNLGVGTAPTTSVAGDVWIATNINFKDSLGTQKTVANTNTSNTYTAPQIIQTIAGTINPALRITQLGSGAALLVEDSTTPDTSALVVNATGDVGIGVAVGFSTSNKFTVLGNSYFSGDILCNNLTAGTSASLGTVTLSSLTFSFNTAITLNHIASQNNPTTSGQVSYADYPKEIIITLNSVSYAVPARII
jgi:hypothetical protein